MPNVVKQMLKIFLKGCQNAVTKMPKSCQNVKVFLKTFLKDAKRCQKDMKTFSKVAKTLSKYSQKVAKTRH